MTSIEPAELQERIAGSLVGAGDDPERQLGRMAAALTEAATRPILHGLIEAIITDRERLRYSARNSYKHHNGFDKIVLLGSDSPSFKLRLHVWRPTHGDAVVENVHNHRWDFATVLLDGGYRFQQYAAAPGGTEMHEYSYQSPRTEERYAMAYVGTTRVRRTLDLLLRRGCSYTLTHDVLHRVVTSPSELAVTLMLQGGIRMQTTRVLAVQPISEAANMAADRMLESDLQGILTSYLALNA